MVERKTKIVTAFICFMLVPAMSVCVAKAENMSALADEIENISYSRSHMTVVTATDILNVREGPCTDASLIGIMQTGTFARVLDEPEGDWVHVSFDDTAGYVNMKYLEVQSRIEYKDRASVSSYKASVDERLLLASLIQCEAGNQPYEGKVAVGAVVMNRVSSGSFPDTIRDVIYQDGQFTPVGSGKVDRVYDSGSVDESCLIAADEALSGASNVGDRCYFHVYDGCEGLVIGDHVFRATHHK